jgi:mono/diheme cytochrome c family protein
MKKQTGFVLVMLFAFVFIFSKCSQPEVKTDGPKTDSTVADNHGYKSQVEYGAHMVILMGCNDCHTPKKMGQFGPELDTALTLSGHPAKMPGFDIDRKSMAAKGLIVTSDLTEWAGPWGTSYAANLTPDDTGLASWDLDQFKVAIRKGKYHGMENGRSLLPPMPWEMYKHMTDDEMAGVFAYLKSIKPIANLVPPPVPPAQ